MAIDIKTCLNITTIFATSILPMYIHALKIMVFALKLSVETAFKYTFFEVHIYLCTFCTSAGLGIDSSRDDLSLLVLSKFIARYDPTREIKKMLCSKILNRHGHGPTHPKGKNSNPS